MLRPCSWQTVHRDCNVPPHLPKKWAREVFLTLPNVRVFIVYDMRNNGDVHKPHGMTEVAYVNGKIVHKGLKVTLSELRKMGRKGFKKICPRVPSSL